MPEFRAYLLTNSVNGRRYVGITGTSLSKRWRRHRQKARAGTRRPLYAAMRKYGEGSFCIEELGVFASWEAACRAEVTLIRDLGTRREQRGYNITAGGEGTPGRKITDSEKAKAQATKAAWPHSVRVAAKQAHHEGLLRSYQERDPKVEVERRTKIAEGRRKHLRSLSADDRLQLASKISTSVKRVWSERTPEEKSSWMKKRKDSLSKRTSSARAEISSGCRERALLQHARMSEEQKRTRQERISAANKNHPKRSRPCEVDGVVYPSIAEASRQTAISKPALRRRLKSERWPTYRYPNK